MEVLRGLIRVIDNAKLADELKDSKQLASLYRLIRSNRIITDEDAEKVFCADRISYSSYQKLKQRLYDRLSDHVLKNGVAYKNLDPYAKLYRKCMSRALSVKTLMMSNARLAGATIGEKLLKTTVAYEFTDITLMVSRELFIYYSAINYNSSKKKKYESLMIKTQELLHKELEANRYYGDLRVDIVGSRTRSKYKTINKAIQYSDRLTPYLKLSYLSYQLLLHCYLVIAMRYELERNYTRLINLCDEAISTFVNRKVKRNAAIYLFDVRKIMCYIMFKKYPQAEELANRHLPNMSPSHFNWFDLKGYILICKLHSRDYQSAYELFHEVRTEHNYNKLPNVLTQIWNLFHAYIEFLISIDRISSDKSTSFRIYKFLNAVPMYSKDKRGVNIAILVIHVLFLLQRRKHDELIDRVDSLNQYCHRHLRKDDTFRSNCFIKMLLQIPTAEFNRQRTMRYTQKLESKLYSMPLHLTSQLFDVEIIPYEDLWEMVLDLLD